MHYIVQEIWNIGQELKVYNTLTDANYKNGTSVDSGETLTDEIKIL